MCCKTPTQTHYTGLTLSARLICFHWHGAFVWFIACDLILLGLCFVTKGPAIRQLGSLTSSTCDIQYLYNGQYYVTITNSDARQSQKNHPFSALLHQVSWPLRGTWVRIQTLSLKSVGSDVRVACKICVKAAARLFSHYGHSDVCL